VTYKISYGFPLLKFSFGADFHVFKGAELALAAELGRSFEYSLLSSMPNVPP